MMGSSKKVLGPGGRSLVRKEKEGPYAFRKTQRIELPNTHSQMRMSGSAKGMLTGK